MKNEVKSEFEVGIVYLSNLEDIIKFEFEHFR